MYAELTTEAARLVLSRHLSGGKPVRRWVAKDKSAGGEKAGKKAEKRAAKLEKKLRKVEKKAAKAERMASKHARAISVPDATEAGVVM